MTVTYTDDEIAAYLPEPKPLPSDYRNRLKLKSKRGHKEAELPVAGANSSDFRLILRQGTFNPLDFSIILAVCPTSSNQLFRLRRYNGKSHEHTNRIENDTLYGFHVHTATERYQQFGAKEDAFAEQTDRYGDFEGAFQCMLNECGFDLPVEPQMSLPLEEQ